MQFLKLARFSKFGAYLVDEKNTEVLLPNKYINKTWQIGELIWVFIYTDSDDRPVAVTTMPFAVFDDIATLEIVDIAQNGVYLNLGIPKDLFMPSKKADIFKKGQNIVVKITKDKQSRLIADFNVAKYLKKYNKDKHIKYVKILPFMKTPLGFNCVVNDLYFGILHNNDISENIIIGKTYKAFAKNIRADGKIDLAMQKNINDLQRKLIEAIKNSGDKLNLHFDTPPEIIFNTLGISKKSFKTAANKLIKSKKAKFIKDKDEYHLILCK